MQVTTGKRYVSDGAATGKWQMAAGSIRYCRYKKLCFSAQLTGFRNRYGLDIGGQKLLQTWQVLRVDAGEHLEDAGCVGRIFPAEQEIISRYSEGLASTGTEKFLVPCSTSARKELDTSAASASFSRLYFSFLRHSRIRLPITFASVPSMGSPLFFAIEVV